MNRKFRKVLSLLLILAILANMPDRKVWAGELTDRGGWDGVTKSSVYETDDYRVTFSLTDYWVNGYYATVRIDNKKDTVIDNWYLRFDSGNTISSIWNAEIDSYEANQYIIKNAGWNQDIAINGSVEFGFSGKEDFQGFPETYEVLGENIETSTEDLAIEYRLDSNSVKWFCRYDSNYKQYGCRMGRLDIRM